MIAGDGRGKKIVWSVGKRRESGVGRKTVVVVWSL